MVEKNFIDAYGMSYELPEEFSHETAEQETVYDWKGEILYEIEQNA